MIFGVFNVLSVYVVALWDMTPCSLEVNTKVSQKSTVRFSRSLRENYVTLQKIVFSNMRNLCARGLDCSTLYHLTGTHVTEEHGAFIFRVELPFSNCADFKVVVFMKLKM